MTDRHSSDEEVEEVERMIGAPGGLRIHRHDDVDESNSDVDGNEDAESQSMQIHHDDHAPADPQVPLPNEPNPIDPNKLTPTEAFKDAMTRFLDDSSDQSTLIETAAIIRKHLAIEYNSPIDEAIHAGCVPKLIELLRDSVSPILQFECTWSLTTISSGSSNHARIVVDAGAIPIFVQLLSHVNDDVREQAIWALGNLAGDSISTRDLVIEANAMPAVLANLNLDNGKLSMLRNATWTLSNLCRGNPWPDWDILKTALPDLARLIYSMDDEVLTDCCWSLSYISDRDNQQIEAVLSLGIARRLLDLLIHRSDCPSVVTPALRTVGNICTGSDSQTQTMVDLNVLECLKTLLDSPRKGFRKEACWTLANISAGSRGQIESAIQSGIYPVVINLLPGQESDIQKEMLYVLSNVAEGGSNQQIQYLIDQGAIEAAMSQICNKNGNNDVKLQQIALDALERLIQVGCAMSAATWVARLETCNALIEQAVVDSDPGIKAKAQEIIKLIDMYLHQTPPKPLQISAPQSA